MEIDYEKMALAYPQDLHVCHMRIGTLEWMNARFKDLLRQIAYPRRGTEEESMNIFDAAKLIQSNFSADELST